MIAKFVENFLLDDNNNSNNNYDYDGGGGGDKTVIQRSSEMATLKQMEETERAIAIRLYNILQLRHTTQV